MSSDAPDASDSFDLRVWVSTIEYEEIHAVQAGLVFFGLAALASSVALLAAGVALLLWAWGIRSSPYRSTKTGDKKTVEELEEVVGDDSSDGKMKGLVAKYLVQIRHEPHYFTTGAVVGDIVGRTIHRLVFDVWPDHHTELGDVVEMLMGSPMVIL